MHYAWFISILTWTVLTAGVLALAIYRHFVAKDEFDVIHLRESEIPLVPGQERLAHRLDTVDFWGKALTAASVAYGLVLVAVFLYQAWNQGLSS